MNDVAISFLIFLSSMLPVRLELYLWVERDEPLRNDVARTASRMGFGEGKGERERLNFSSLVQLDISHSMRSLVSYRVQNSKRNSVSTRAHVLFSIYQCYLMLLLVILLKYIILTSC